jgi:hypothetical protein
MDFPLVRIAGAYGQHDFSSEEVLVANLMSLPLDPIAFMALIAGGRRQATRDTRQNVHRQGRSRS